MEKIWSPQQKAITTFFRSGKGNLLVRARAGSGKTTTIIEAIKHAIERMILLCAFNKEIADELSRRLTNPNASARTLHSVGNGFIFKNWGKVEIDRNRGRKLATKALKEIGAGSAPIEIVTLVKELASKAKGMEPLAFTGAKRQIDKLIVIAESFDLVPPKEFVAEGMDVDLVALAASKAMKLATVKDGTIDYDDMIFLPLANKWAYPKYDLIVVDEAQDMNRAQLMLAQRVARGRIVIVGDDRQAIYGFRGADSGSLDRLKTELNAAELGLTVTYRCPKNIVALAQEVVPDFEAHSSAPEGIVDEIRYEALYDFVSPGDFILSRKNAPLAKICLKLVRSGRRAIIRGREMGEALAGLIRRFEASDMKTLFDELRSWEEKTIQSINDQGQDADEERIEMIADQAATIRAIAEGIATPAELLTRIEKFFVADRESDLALGAAITCSTVHKAKGLESDRVFLIKETFRKGRSNEEDNIWYVATTRAKAHLTWVTGKSE